jgi:hypothetical protein
MTGCRDAPLPKPLAPAGVSLPPDEEVMLVLDYFEPMYQIDGSGRVIRLRLTNRPLSGAAMKEINKLTELINVDFYGANVNDDDLAQLQDLQKLKTMGLGATQMTDKGLANLAKLKSLRFVWVSKASISQAAVDTLNETRPDIRVFLQ